MSNIIQGNFSPRREDVIDVRTLTIQTRKLREGLIAPAKIQVEEAIVDDHAAEPIKSMETIIEISEYLVTNERYRDNMLFIVGINLGLRVSDLRVLRFSHLINENLTFKDGFEILEKKTRNTRKHQKNRKLSINDAIVEAVTLYLVHTPNVSLSDYLFKSESNRHKGSEPIHRNSIDRILKGIAEELGLSNKVSTHTLRKTFGYHQMVMSGNSPRKLLMLQKMFGHSTSAQTLDYIGITSEEIDEAYRQLNLGSKDLNYLVRNTSYEEAELTTA